jgi:cytochrome c-type biogenesis protein CcmF
VRSGVLTSVHAFATDPARGIFILAFLALVIGGSLALFAWRAPRVGLGGAFEPVSREGLLLANNVLLVVAAASVLLATLYPLLLDALGLGKISVGPPYFEAVFVPLMAPAVFLMGVGPLARWKQTSVPELARRLRWALAVAIVAALLAPAAAGRWTPMVSFGLLLAFWVFASAWVNLRARLAGGTGGPGARLRAQPRSYYGMLAAHCGVAVFIVGVTLVRGYEVERDVRLAPGDTVTVAGYAFRFEGAQDFAGPNYRGVRGAVAVTRDGRAVALLEPEKRMYRVQQNPMTEAAIASGPLRDLYVSLGEPVSGGAWSVRVYYKPFVAWIWAGCAIMALGGLLAISDRRYRVAVRRFSPPTPLPREAGGALAKMR